MSAIALIGAVGYVVLLVYFFALWARFVLDLVQAFSESWRPRGVVLVLALGHFFTLRRELDAPDEVPEPAEVVHS